MYYRRCWTQTLNQTAKMSQRLLDNTKWLWCLLVLHAGSFWGQTRSVTVRTPPGNPAAATVEAQAKFFQYRHFPTTEEFNQGHRLGSERHFTERHERARPSEGLFSAKVRWGDKKGGYGEHYWDLNHAGNVGNHGDDDDGSYDESKHSDPYDDHSDNTPNYGNDDYDPEKSSYEENGRAKRAHPKIKVERKRQRHSESYEEESKPKRKNREDVEAAATHQDDEYSENDDEDDDEEVEEETYEKPKPRRHQYRKKEDKQEEQKPKDKNQFVLVVTQKDDSEKKHHRPQYSGKQNEQQYQPEVNQYLPKQQPELNPYLQKQQADLNQYLPKQQVDLNQYLPKQQPELNQYLPKKQQELPAFVPYEGGAGVRQHHPPEVTAANTVPRLFLEPSTGHVVDRATGQAYVLQPIAPPKNYN
ncbi:uncharacterized protein LOC142972818 isoform X2 [Anticarsia gemmatalis]|uniref:uncharacterized protein LOC142972818 isoform X2 n=1 Tax=Anticarsia gemmatalis TaxID=129554 RepID=UPI003F763C5B